MLTWSFCERVSCIVAEQHVQGERDTSAVMNGLYHYLSSPKEDGFLLVWALNILLRRVCSHVMLEGCTLC